MPTILTGDVNLSAAVNRITFHSAAEHKFKLYEIKESTAANDIQHTAVSLYYFINLLDNVK